MAEKHGDETAEIDLEDLPPKTLRKMIRALMAKCARKPGDPPADEEGSEKEREDRADLHEEKKGKGHKQPVEKDDLPFDLGDDEPDDGDDVSEADEEKGSRGRKKK